MLADPECPACGNRNWSIIGERIYRAEALSARSPAASRILFKTWLPGTIEFRAKFGACRGCAFVTCLPRPSEDDIRKKYEQGAQLGHYIPSKGEAPERTRRRARRLARIVTPHLTRSVDQSRILDFGGGDGRLLDELVSAGASGDVVDYCRTPVPGVRHIGNTEEDLPRTATYDAVICSHVVEHLAMPHSVLQRLRMVIRLGGILYVEVPVELIKSMPAAREPVTHCNFFIPESLATLLQRSGFRLLECKLTTYPHPGGGWSLCVAAIATPDEDVTASLSGIEALNRYLRPPLPFMARIQLMSWRTLPQRFYRKFRSRAGR
ncbi:class I SAM-dependent methyltransferase [Sphingosinicella terrae]|uniref:class I SAM-dependent methyltransferase n=1 Tax=Sphingosinicella terrae TaxID=2172047 RepID=UPI000E0DA9C5|nr:class I SAM-dependent methyltransferase [Sphingosinicella terrae]